MSRFPTLALCLIASFGISLPGSDTQTLRLSGSGNNDTVEWEFRVNGGRRANEWTSIPVPSNWEFHGFGTYNYRRDYYGEFLAPDSLGEYRRHFHVPPDWEGQRVDIVFGGAMTDTDVRINGIQAGPKHQGGFYQFSYEITDLLMYGRENLIEVTVQKFSDDESINRAERHGDYWVFGGIYRSVWLEARPQEHIDRIAVDARHDGKFSVDVYLDGVTRDSEVIATIFTLDGAETCKSESARVKSGQEHVRLAGHARDVESWSAEQPHLYTLEVALVQNEDPVHIHRETIGFRTIEVRPRDGIYVNGQRIILKGVNRHSFWPTSGRTTSASLSESDIRLMKEMNMNAVRMSHYPPDSHFLDACDRLGLYVINELAGWQKQYDTEPGARLIKEMISRDVNHPSIILWANGNEGGWNNELDDHFGIYDPQKRTVIHPWDNFGGIDTSHYERYNSGTGVLFDGEDLILPTEFLHALYDGGGGAGMEDWWRRMLAHPLGSGGFVWAFVDEGVVRDDLGGRIDVAGNQAPDGLLGPFREKEGSFFALKEIWAPIYLPRTEVDTLPPTFDGRLSIENRYNFTNLHEIHFEWRLIEFRGQAISSLQEIVHEAGTFSGPDVEPGRLGEILIPLPEKWSERDVLELGAYGPEGDEIYTWRWTLSTPEAIAAKVADLRASPTSKKIENVEQQIVLRTDDVEVVIDRNSGRLRAIRRGSVETPLRNGPIILHGEAALTDIAVEDGAIVARYEGPLRLVRWQLLESGWLQLDYEYEYNSNDGALSYMGVSFDYDESLVSGMTWLGKGPYRIWKNRRKGMEFGLWRKDYNDTITGQSWDYPEFKGFHEDVYLARLESETLPLEIIIASPDITFRVFTPSEASDAGRTSVKFPEGDLSFLHGFAPIGTKFSAAEQQGPMGEGNLTRRRGQVFKGAIYFRFGEK